MQRKRVSFSIDFMSLVLHACCLPLPKASSGKTLVTRSPGHLGSWHLVVLKKLTTVAMRRLETFRNPFSVRVRIGFHLLKGMPMQGLQWGHLNSKLIAAPQTSAHMASQGFVSKEAKPVQGLRLAKL